MKKFRLLGSTIALCLLLFLAACNNTTAPPGNGPGPAPTPEPPQDGQVVVADVTNVADQETKDALIGFDLTTGELRFSSSTELLESLENGDILVAEPLDGRAPFGFLRKVTNKRTEGGEVVLETEQATLEETFDKANIDYRQDLKPEDLLTPQFYYPGITLLEPHEVESQASKSFNFNLDFNEVLIDVDGDESTTNDQLRVDGQFKFDARAEADIDIGYEFPLDVSLDLFRFLVRLEESVDVQMTGTLSGEANIDLSVPVAALPFGTFTVFVGPVPVVFSVTLVIEAGANGRFDAELVLSATQTTTIQIGAEYTGSWKNLNSFESDFDFPTPQITASAAARAFARPQLDVMIYGLAGPYVYATAFVEADAEFERDPFWQLSAGLGFGLGFKVDLPVVGRVASYDTTLAEYKQALDSSPNEAPTIEIVSPEEGASFVEGVFLETTLRAADREQARVDVKLVDTAQALDIGTGDVISGGTTELGTSRLCIGNHNLVATATDDKGVSTSDTVTVRVENRVPTVSFFDESDLTQEKWYPGGFLYANAIATDYTCASDTNVANPNLIKWFLDGSQVATTEDLFFRLDGYTAGDQVTVQARYVDEHGALGTSSTVTLTLDPVPPGGIPVTAIIEVPASAVIETDDEVSLEGVGFDAEDGRLAGSSLTWEVQALGGSYKQVGTGEEASFSISAFGGYNTEHTVRLTARDSDGNVGVRTFTFTPLPIL